jgi:hypothetical protein
MQNNYQGVVILGQGVVGNTITQNSITDNIHEGIYISPGSNGGIQPPVITLAGFTVMGTASPLSTVEVFSDSGDEGAVYEGTVQADEAGNFAWHGVPRGPFITATATDAAGDSSAFSAPVAPIYRLSLPVILS